MGFGMLDSTIVGLSLFILITICIVLVILVFGLAVSYWRLQNKQARGLIATHSKANNKHHLTGLGNRVLLLENLDKIISGNKQNNVNTALIFFDLDDFNNINTTIGLKIGDEVLKAVGHTIDSKMRALTNHTYHIGNDEFVVILHDCGNTQQNVGEIANEVIQEISKPITIDGYELHLSCSAGICIHPDCANDAHELLKYAGCARDNAKKIGFNSYSFYTQDMSKKSVMRALITEELRFALERNEFSLRYQPIISMSTGKVVSIEALLRWHHPSLGNITPDIFIPVIEDLGMIHAVGRWVIKTACMELSKLHHAGFSDLSIAINLSAHQFNKGDIANIIAEAIWESGISPSHVELELTEAVVMSDTEKSELMMKVLQSMGVKIAVDDFGTGYSSLNHLSRFPVSILKIDRSFVDGINHNPTNAAIVTTVMRMAKQLGFSVVAEGVETKEELEVLKKEGCDRIQGFYFSKPLSFADLEEYLRNFDAQNHSINQQDHVQIQQK